MMPEADFNAIWEALMEPIRELEKRVTDIERQASRAEVAGAVEVAASLPTAGEKGRLMFRTSDNLLYYDNGTSWVGLGAGPTFVGARYSSNSPQIFNNNTLKIMNYEDQDFDTHSAVTVGAAWKFTAPVAGYYQVNARINFQAYAGWMPPEHGQLELHINGGVKSRFSRDDTMYTNCELALWGSDCVLLAVDDYIQIKALQASGGAISTTSAPAENYVSIAKVG